MPHSIENISNKQTKAEIQKAIIANGLTKIIAVTSGKGGVGKTNISTNLAIALAQQGAKVCIFDADTSLANINIVMGLSAQYTIEHLLNGEKTMEEILIQGPQGVRIVPSASGISSCANLDKKQRQRLITALAQLEDQFDYLIIDTAAGLGHEVIDFICSAQYVLLVISAEPTSLTDTFALVRTLQRQGCKRPLYAVVSQAKNYSDSWKTYSRFQAAVKKYLQVKIRYLGYIGDDDNLKAAVCEQKPVLLYKANTHASRCFKVLANVVKKQFNEGGQQHSFSEYWRKLADNSKPRFRKNEKPLIKQKSGAKGPIEHTVSQSITDSLTDWLKDEKTTQKQAAHNLKLMIDVYIKRFQRLPYQPEKYLSWLVANEHYSEEETRHLLQKVEAQFMQCYQKPVYDLETIVAQLLNSLGLPADLTGTLKNKLRNKSILKV